MKTLTWEETVMHARKSMPELIKRSYLSENLEENVINYGLSLEFKETLQLLSQEKQGCKLLDIGSGNGITAINLALNGFDVVAVEPDISDSVGSGAIARLKDEFSLTDNLCIITQKAEKLQIVEKFDIIFMRQSLHHAEDLNKFVGNLANHLKKGGLFVAVREHVVFDEEDKSLFLKNHPLNKYYFGENAYTLNEYANAFTLAGLEKLEIIKFFDSPINFYPMNKYFAKIMSKEGIVFKIIRTIVKFGTGGRFLFDEVDIHGRMYSFIAVKK